MEKLDLKNYEVVALDGKDVKLTNGGGAFTTFIGIATVVIYCYNNADDFVEGFKRGYNGE